MNKRAKNKYKVEPSGILSSESKYTENLSKTSGINPKRIHHFEITFLYIQ
jgi:hypothetical protein